MFKGQCCSGNGEKRKPRIASHIIGGIALAIGFALVFSIFVQMLWNWLMPHIFNLGTITWGQAFGLILLARMLFGSMGHHRPDRHGFGKRMHGFHRLSWRGCGCTDEDAANHDIENWEQYDAWWNAEGREAFKKFAVKPNHAKDSKAS